MPTDKILVIIFFDPDCDHCQYEARQIRESIHLFEDEALVFISTEPLKAIHSFSKKYELSNYPFVHFTKVNREEAFDTFGALSVPHIFIYNKEGKLIREFKGETKVEAILDYLP